MNMQNQTTQSPRLQAKARTSRSRVGPDAVAGQFCLVGLVSLALCLCASGQNNYVIDWYAMDSGGGTSTSAVYAVTGIIGQPDADKLTSASYVLEGGFWSFVAAIQTPGAPRLWAMLTTTNTVCVWWPLSDTSWQLEVTTTLVPGGSVWTACAYVTNGGNCVYIQSPPAGKRFYRLKQ
jgi:hypothetical protein